MTPNQLLHGFAGGLVGLILAVPLTVHEAWMRMLNMQELHDKPITFKTFIFSTILIMPILLLIGVLGSPLIAAYAAYQCSKESSLEPIAATFARPYQENRQYTDYYHKIGHSVLAGYSLVLFFTGFAVLNILTGGAVSLLATPGIFMISLIGLNASSLVPCTIGALLIPYAVGLLAGGATALNEPHDHEFNEFGMEMTEIRSGYALLRNDDDSPPSSGSLTPFYDAQQTIPDDGEGVGAGASPDKEEEEIIYFGERGSPNSPPRTSPPV